MVKRVLFAIENLFSPYDVVIDTSIVLIKECIVLGEFALLNLAFLEV